MYRSTLVKRGLSPAVARCRLFQPNRSDRALPSNRRCAGAHPGDASKPWFFLRPQILPEGEFGQPLRLCLRSVDDGGRWSGIAAPGRPTATAVPARLMPRIVTGRAADGAHVAGIYSQQRCFAVPAKLGNPARQGCSQVRGSSLLPGPCTTARSPPDSPRSVALALALAPLHQRGFMRSSQNGDDGQHHAAELTNAAAASETGEPRRTWGEAWDQ